MHADPDAQALADALRASLCEQLGVEDCSQIEITGMNTGQQGVPGAFTVDVAANYHNLIMQCDTDNDGSCNSDELAAHPEAAAMVAAVQQSICDSLEGCTDPSTVVIHGIATEGGSGRRRLSGATGKQILAQAMQAGLMQGHIVTTPGEMITELAHRKVQVDVSPVNVGKLSDSLEGRAFADGRLTESELGSDADARALGRAVAARVCKHLGMTDEGCVKMKGLDNVTPQLGSSAEFMVPRQLPMSDKKVQDAIKLAINQLAAER